MRNKISFITTLNEGKPEEVFVRINAYQCHNGLAVGHPVKDDDGIYGYKAGWIVYHIASGKIVKSTFDGKPHKTPADAMNFARTNCKGKILSMLRKHENTSGPVCDCPAEVLGKLKTWPKPKPKMDKRLAGTEKFDGKKFAGLLHLIGQIDDARANAYRTSEQQITFKISRSTFTIGASLEALNRFRAMVIKNRMAFADKAFQVKPENTAVENTNIETIMPICAEPIKACNLESNRMVKQLSDSIKAALSARAQETIRSIMVKDKFSYVHSLKSEYVQNTGS